MTSAPPVGPTLPLAPQGPSDSNEGQPEPPTPPPSPKPVREWAKALKLEPIDDQTVAEGTPLTLTISVAEDEEPGGELRFQLGPDAPEGVSLDAETGVFTWTPAEGQAGKTHVVSVLVSAGDSEDLHGKGSFRVTVESLWDAHYRVVKEAVYLIEAQSSGNSWSLATCVAISDDTLLSTAKAACEMEWMRHQKEADDESAVEYEFFVTHRASQTSLPIKDIRIFAPFAEEQENWVYFDLAMLTVDGKLPRALTLASQDERRELVEPEHPVAVVAVGHDAQRIGKSFTGEPRLAVGEVYTVTQYDKSPGSPWAMYLKMDAPSNARGSPVINRQGHVVGVYSVAALPQDGLEFNLHCAPVVDPGLIDTWLTDQNEDIWTAPFVPDIPLESQNTP